MSYLVVSGICVLRIKKLSDSTLSQHDKEFKRMGYVEVISYYKSMIASIEDVIISYEELLGGRGESSIIRYY